jgi:hypothetical protein
MLIIDTTVISTDLCVQCTCQVFDVPDPLEDDGQRVIDFTRDIGAVGIQFEGALRGDVGPFIQWDSTDGESLTVSDSATGQVLNFVGDPNIPHTYTGSPTGFNKVRHPSKDASGPEPLLSVLVPTLTGR